MGDMFLHAGDGIYEERIVHLTEERDRLRDIVYEARYMATVLKLNGIESVMINEFIRKYGSTQQEDE